MEAPHARTDESMRGWETLGLKKNQERKQVGKSWGHSRLGRICAPNSQSGKTSNPSRLKQSVQKAVASAVGPNYPQPEANSGPNKDFRAIPEKDLYLQGTEQSSILVKEIQNIQHPQVQSADLPRITGHATKQKYKSPPAEENRSVDPEMIQTVGLVDKEYKQA